MALEPARTYRLVRRGDPGLTCDAEGVTLGGVPLAWANDEPEVRPRWRVRKPEEIGRILELAYGRQDSDVLDGCHRGLRRAAAQLEAGDLALAGIEALMLRLPPIGAEGIMAKLAVAAEFQKGGDAWQDQPRAPAGQPDGGQWTTGGGTPSPAPQQSTSRSDGGSGGKPPDRLPDRPAPAASDLASEITVTSTVHQSGRQNAKGFYPTSAGGGVFYIPSVVLGQPVRSTEVVADDANAFQVAWHDGVISLKDARGNVVEVPATTPEQLHSFNITTGRTLGVAIHSLIRTSRSPLPTVRQHLRSSSDVTRRALLLKPADRRRSSHGPAESPPERCWSRQRFPSWRLLRWRRRPQAK